MRIIYYRDKCIGCNYCGRHGPNAMASVFSIGGWKKGQVYRADVGEHERELNEREQQMFVRWM